MLMQAIAHVGCTNAVRESAQRKRDRDRERDRDGDRDKETQRQREREINKKEIKKKNN